MPRRGKMRVGNPAPDDGLGGLVKDGEVIATVEPADARRC